MFNHFKSLGSRYASRSWKEAVSAKKVGTPVAVYHLILILLGPHLSVTILMTDQEDASINGHWLEYLDKTWLTGSALMKLRDPLSARITVIAAVDGPTPLLGPFPSEMTLMIEAEDAHISGELRSNRLYQVHIYWHAESVFRRLKEATNVRGMDPHAVDGVRRLHPLVCFEMIQMV